LKNIHFLAPQKPGGVKMPHKSSVPMVWRLQKNKYNLIGTICSGCSKKFFPPRAVCPDCGENCNEFSFCGEGIIESFTIIHAAPAGFEEKIPYTIGLVKLKEGPVISSQIIGNVGIGKSVKNVFRRLCVDGKDGLIHYGFKFECID
jgi:uncharacterized OB-fold protein